MHERGARVARPCNAGNVPKRNENNGPEIGKTGRQALSIGPFFVYVPLERSRRIVSIRNFRLLHYKRWERDGRTHNHGKPFDGVCLQIVS